MLIVIEPTQIFTLAGVVLSFIVGVAGLWIGIKNTRKTIFINSITASRIEYIQDLRNSIADFCGRVSSYKFNEEKINKLKQSNEIEELYKIYRELSTTVYLISLYLNPEDVEWDTKIMKLMTEIINDLSDGNTITTKIGDLTLITQYLLKLEWEGVKRESVKGNLSKKEKRKLYRKHLQLYEQRKKV